jgi:putative DNA primase/helicase
VPNQWALCIGRPGVMKTPAMEDALRPVKMLAATARQEFNLAKAQYEINAAAAKVRTRHAEKEPVTQQSVI